MRILKYISVLIFFAATLLALFMALRALGDDKKGDAAFFLLATGFFFSQGLIRLEFKPYQKRNAV